MAGAGCEPNVSIVDGWDFDAAIRELGHEPVVVVAGGDGTVAMAAGAFVHSRTAVAILPLGMRNQLARQLEIPLDLEAAARIACEGQRRRIDLGLAGTRVFVNSASFGIYARYVRHRDDGKKRSWFASLGAIRHALSNMREQRFALRIDGRSQTLRTPLLFIGNNQYSFEPWRLGKREDMIDGALSLYAIAAQRPASLLAFVAKAVIGIATPSHDFKAFMMAEQVVIDGDGSIEGVFDGEIERMALPLTLRTMPAGLGVVTAREAVPAEKALSRIH